MRGGEGERGRKAGAFCFSFSQFLSFSPSPLLNFSSSHPLSCPRGDDGFVVFWPSLFDNHGRTVTMVA